MNIEVRTGYLYSVLVVEDGNTQIISDLCDDKERRAFAIKLILAADELVNRDNALTAFNELIAELEKAEGVKRKNCPTNAQNRE